MSENSLGSDSYRLRGTFSPGRDRNEAFSSFRGQRISRKRFRGLKPQVRLPTQRQTTFDEIVQEDMTTKYISEDRAR